MKTLIIFNEVEEISYAIVDGNYSRFNGVMFNSFMPEQHPYEDECGKFMFNDNDGTYNLDFSNDISLIENKHWDKVAVITFLP